MGGLKIELELDDDDVAFLRGESITLEAPDRIFDKLEAALGLRQPGWYLVTTQHSTHPRPRWWSGKKWYWGSDQTDSYSGPALVTDDTHAIRLYEDGAN